MVLKSVKLERLEFETLVLEKIIFGKSITDEIWLSESLKALFSGKKYNERPKTESG